MSRSTSNNPADWTPADQKSTAELVAENRETFESIAETDTWLGDIVEALLREVDRRD